MEAAAVTEERHVVRAVPGLMEASLSAAATRFNKEHGIHYTPVELADYLAQLSASAVRTAYEHSQGGFVVLDPACGDGGLLKAFALAVPSEFRERLVLVGYDTDGDAVRAANESLGALGLSASITHADFLEIAGDRRSGVGELALSNAGPAVSLAGYSLAQLVISNPPYVRTQVLGAERAQNLSARFGLTGRVDLYQVFVRAMSACLASGGTLALLTSNRLLSVKSGSAIRRMILEEFEPRLICDLGDTKLFRAAVLPAILIAQKRPCEASKAAAFVRVYTTRSPTTFETKPVSSFGSVVRALVAGASGQVVVPTGAFGIERGVLAASDCSGDTWSLSSSDSDAFLEEVKKGTSFHFADLFRVRVGIKTTADSVFIRDDWELLPSECRPESSLLRPLITHHVGARWLPELRSSQRRVLYPHECVDGKRCAISLPKYPRASAYLKEYQAQLEGRTYVREAGREWYELWVPQDPNAWRLPKVVWPDISEGPRFSLDTSGAIVNGDCYWMTLREGLDPRWLLLALAVANSSLGTRYYDTRFHNKLYSGRRRFMTQYVSDFPLPRLELPVTSELIQAARVLTEPNKSREEVEALNARVDRLVWRAFGVSD